MDEPKSYRDSFRLERSQELEALEKLLSWPKAKLVMDKLIEQGIDTPVIEAGVAYFDEDSYTRHVSLPFRSSKTGLIHGTLESIGDYVQGLYVPLDEESWHTFVVVVVKAGQAETHILPWSELHQPGPNSLLTLMALDRSFLVLDEAHQDISYKALFISGNLCLTENSQVVFVNPDIGYYTTIAVCAV